VLDDKYEVNSKLQLFIQIIAIVPLLATGISVDTIQNPFDTSINLRSLVIPLTIGAQTFSLALPADIITLVWILIMINAINWLFGIDALGEGISIIAFTTILLVSVKLGNPITAVLAATAIGGILGFIPFNLYPSKIISGTAGNTVYGFLIAAFSIVGGIKVSSSVIVLLIPLIDMIWVMIGRINRHGVSNFFDIFKVTTIGDNTHLHHRLLKLGFSTVQVATIEWLAVWVCAVIAFSSGNLPKATLIGSITVITLLVFFIISILLKKGVNIRKKKMNRPTEPPTHRVDTPESRYAY